jgi:hypothetical protein
MVVVEAMAPPTVAPVPVAMIVPIGLSDGRLATSRVREWRRRQACRHRLPAGGNGEDDAKGENEIFAHGGSFQLIPHAPWQKLPDPMLKGIGSKYSA